MIKFLARKVSVIMKITFNQQEYPLVLENNHTSVALQKCYRKR
ncbi:hypothetical protein [Loigolactobacillus backii]|nr:hypothetical protein [Loigolactobacillus backii]